MPCPHCATTATEEQTQRTALSYRTFRCRVCPDATRPCGSDDLPE